MNRWRPSTRTRAERIYANYLRFLRDHKLLDANAKPSGRISETCLRPYVDDQMSRLAPQSVGKKLGIISMAVGAMEPDADRTLINQVVAWMDQNKKPSIDKNKIKVTPVELHMLGSEIMGVARKRSANRQVAADFRDGLAIALMALCPIRIGVFAKLRLRETLVNAPDGIRLMIPVEQTKTSKPLDVPFPTELLEQLHIYLCDYRPLISSMSETNPALWINFKGEEMSDALLRGRFTKWAVEKFGYAVSPHRFRDAAATYIYEQMPERALLAAAVLQHSDFRTTQRHYIRGEQRTAALGYHKAIKSLIADNGSGGHRG